MSDLTHQRLLDLLHYDPQTGIFIWLVTHHRIYAGDRAGCEHHPRGRQPWRDIMIDQKAYRENRLAWFYMTGAWPAKEVDHRNRDPLDTVWDNLRLATSSQNKANQGVRRDNKSGFKGVHPHGRRFYARTNIDRKYQYLGMADTAEQASEIYKAATLAVHGEFARHE